MEKENEIIVDEIELKKKLMEKENEIIVDEIELKKKLDELGYRYGNRFSTVGYVVSFLDTNSGALIYQLSANSPISALRVLPELCKQKQLGADDISVIIDFAFDMQSRNCTSVDLQISPYIYFKKQEISVSPDTEKIE